MGYIFICSTIVLILLKAESKWQAIVLAGASVAAAGAFAAGSQSDRYDPLKD
jgi:hypothetical protein